ncbi:hypothetical protein R3P38DRAFT_3445580 [Favolaschia claudopus]|uniref:F-box domain-containing protein n=1 Tax=Favolaschia claudopus TaxID=2862362 RepID=A0AAV9ZNG5_9AGAR
MVLTRSASRAAKCIFRWLPNEILDLVATELGPADLAALCRVSRLLRNIASPLLYDFVELSTSSSLIAFARTIRQSVDASLPNSVHALIVAKFTDKKPPISPSIVKEINEALCRLIRLEALILLAPCIDYAQVLERAQFPELVFFRYFIASNVLPTLTSFLNRHKIIIDLALIAPWRLKFPTPLSLPKLQYFFGSFAFLSTLDLTDVSLTKLSLLSYPLDTATDHATLVTLHEMKMLSTVEVMGILEVNEREILHVIAAHLRCVQKLVFCHSVGSSSHSISPEEVLSIAASLETLGQLRSIDFGAVGGNVIEDRRMVEQWSAACKSLTSVTLDERKWEFKENDWVVSWNL